MDNGSKPHAQPSSNIFDETGFSPDYHALKASMDAYVVWEGMPLQQRLEFIWNQLPKEQWLEDFYLPTLAEALPDAVQWARTTERYKDLFGSPKSLEAAVKQYLAAQQDTSDTSALEETTRARQRPVVVSMDTVQAESVEWLWWPYIAVGNLCMLVGDPGVGKSLLMTQLAASLSRGYPLPDQQGQPTLPTGGPHVTLLLCTEDGLANTIKPRLQAAGADCSQVKVLTGWLGPEDEEYAFTLLHMGVL